MPSNPPSFRYRLEYAAFLMVSALMTALPVEMASALGGRILRVLGPFSRKRRPRALENLAKAYPEMSEGERNDLALAVWEEFGRVLGEFFHLQEIVQERIVCENPEVLAQLVENGGGSVICGAHQANWEAAAGIMVRHGLNPMAVYYPMNNPFVDAAMKRRREPLYPGGLMAKGDTSTPRKMMRHARNCATVAFLVDQYTHNGLPICFFGRSAASTAFPAMIARYQGVPLVVLHVTRKPGVRFVITCEAVPVPRTADKKDDIFAATAAVQSALERSIRHQPDQWMIWNHRRWN